MIRRSGLNLSSVLRTLLVLWIVKTAKGESAIESRSQYEAVSVGDDVILRCSLSSLEEDTPPILWTHNQKLLTNSRIVLVPDTPRIKVSGQDGGLGFDLILHQVTVADEGEYMCQMAGSQGDKVVHRLTVNIPPSIEEVYPANPALNVLSGESLRLECAARGKPTPTISWRKLEEDTDAKIYQFGEALELKSLNRSQNGTYSCTAANGFGRPVTHLFHVNVEYIPVLTISTNAIDVVEDPHDDEQRNTRVNYLHMPNYHLSQDQRYDTNPIQHANDPPLLQFHVRYASMLIINCSVSANPSAHVTWSHNGTRLSADGDGKMIRTTDADVSTLTVGSVTGNDVGVYRCLADNRIGSAYRDVTIRGHPYDVYIASEPVSVFSDQYIVKWSLRSASPVQHCHIRLTQAIVRNGTTNETKAVPLLEIKQLKYSISTKNSGSSKVETLNEPLLQNFSHVIDHLTAEAKYSISVQAENSFGPSEWSEEFQFETAPEGNSAPSSTTTSAQLPRHHFLRDDHNGSIANRKGYSVFTSLLFSTILQLLGTTTLL